MTHPRGREGHFHRLLPSLAASANRTLPSASRNMADASRDYPASVGKVLRGPVWTTKRARRAFCRATAEGRQEPGRRTVREPGLSGERR